MSAAPAPAAVDALASRRFAAVLFDLDGTLIDSTASVVRSWLRWAAELGIDPERLRHAHGRPSGDIVASVVPAAGVAAAIARIDEIELADTAGIVPLPGTVAALAALPPARVAIVTSCGPELARARIAAAGLPTSGALVTAGDIANGKPHPEPYLLGAARLGVAPADCLVVEDAPAGLASGRAAGCATLAVAGTHALVELVADGYAHDLSHVRLVVDDTGIAITAAG